MNKRDEASLRNIEYSLSVVCRRASDCDSCVFKIIPLGLCVRKTMMLLLSDIYVEDTRREDAKSALREARKEQKSEVSDGKKS